MIGISIIGLGAIGERLLPIFKDHNEIEIISVYDIDQEKTIEICDKYNVKPVASISEMLNDDAVQAVYLAVPPKFHKDLALDIMNSGKHILCEKPLANTIEEAEIMMEFAKGKPLINGMNFPLYHGPAYKKLKEMLNEKKIGKIKRIELNGIFPDWPRKWQINPWIDSKDQGGFVREIFTHFIQLIHDYFGLIEINDSNAVYPEDPKKSEIDILARGQINNIPLVFNGMTGIGHKEDLKLSIWGSEGVIEFVNWRDLFLINRDQKIQIELDPYNATYNLIDSFRKAVEGEPVQLVDFEAGYHAVRIVEELLG
ncbi:Gfo/Idh/MocA family oxidoreductase [Mycoplasmatota bacterium zrk1]